MSLTLTNENGRIGTYYYGDIITISSTTPFTELKLYVNGMNSTTTICSFPDATTGTIYKDDHGNVYYNYDACFYKYTITSLIYNTSYYFSTGTEMAEFTYSIASDLLTDAFTYLASDSITITCDTPFTELRLCKSIVTDTWLIYEGDPITSITLSFLDISDQIQNKPSDVINSFTLESGNYFVGTAYNVYMSIPFLYCEITMSPLKTSYYKGETVTFAGTYTLCKSDGTQIGSADNSYTFGVLDETSYYFKNDTFKTPSFTFRNTSSSFYLTPEMDTFFNTGDDENGQSYKLIKSQLFDNKSLIVPFGGNASQQQQGTSEAHCYFVTSIVNQYMTSYMYYKSNGTLTTNTDKLFALLDKLVYAINFMCEIISINCNDASNYKATIGQVFFPPWEFLINSEVYLECITYKDPTDSTKDTFVPWSAQDSNQQLTCSLLRLWLFDTNHSFLNTYICGKLFNTSDLAILPLNTTYDWGSSTTIDFNEQYTLDIVLNNLIQKCIVDLAQSGNYKITDKVIFGSGTYTISSDTTIEDEHWSDYVSFYGYVLVQYYVNSINTPVPSLDVSLDNYTQAVSRDITWLLETPLLDLMGDGPSATFNRLAFQIAEIVDVYNNGDSTIGLSSDEVKKYFTFDNYNKICSIMNDLLSREITTPTKNAVVDGCASFELDNQYYLNFYYVDGMDGDPPTTFTSGSDVISGYARMISYLLMLENNLFMIYKRNDTTSARYLENMSFTQLLTDTHDIPLNLAQVTTKWSNVYTSSTASDFNSSWMQYLSGNNRYCLDSSNQWSSDATSSTSQSWCVQTGPYFAWSILTLHMAAYRLNRSIPM